MYSGRLRRPRRGGGGLGLINIRLRYIASIEYSKRFFFFLAIVKRFVGKKIGGREQGGGHDPQNPPSGSAPGEGSLKWPTRRDGPFLRTVLGP